MRPVKTSQPTGTGTGRQGDSAQRNTMSAIRSRSGRKEAEGRNLLRKKPVQTRTHLERETPDKTRTETIMEWGWGG